jgi:hypothetical protein
MASGEYGSHYAAERWYQQQEGADREDRLIGLVPNDQLDAYNAATYPPGTVFIDVGAIIEGEDPGITYTGSAEDPRPITSPDQL